MRALADTSVIADIHLPEVLQKLPKECEFAISVITIGELRIGVMLADSPQVKSRRLNALTAAEKNMEALPVDLNVVAAFCEIVVDARQRGLRPKIADSLIAATAAAHSMPIFTRDKDFIGLSGIEATVI